MAFLNFITNPSLLLGAIAVVGLPLFWFTFVKAYFLRRFYEKQGIPFIKNCHVVIGAELQVTKLRERNKSHDWLYTDRPLDIVGTVRGFNVQLYATSAEMSEKVVAETGKHVDRNTPALFSFGQLSPFAITFTPLSEPFFTERKACLLRALKDEKRLYGIATRQAYEALEQYDVRDGTNRMINVRDILNRWTRETSGEFIWGKNNVNCSVDVLDAKGNLVSLPFMTALNHTFTDLRFHSNKFWNRVYFPLAAWPITKEARRLAFNVRVLRDEMGRMMSTPEEGSIAARVQAENDATGIPSGMTRDDLVTATIAGLDTVKSTTMGTLWHIMQEENSSWKDEIMKEIEAAQADPKTTYAVLGRCENFNAVMHETLRYEPPGSLINNEATHDFDLTTSMSSYQIKAGTRIVPCIHALHQNEYSWGEGLLEKTASLDKFDPSRFLIYGKDIVGSKYFMPFGKGPRRCPGQNVGALMVKCFIAAFLNLNAASKIVLPQGQAKDITCFNILSVATYNIHCGAETEKV